MLKRLIKGERGIKANPETKSDGLKSNSRRTSPQLYFFFLPLMNKLVRKLFFFVSGTGATKLDSFAEESQNFVRPSIHVSMKESQDGRCSLKYVGASIQMIIHCRMGLHARKRTRSSLNESETMPFWS